MDQLKSIFRVTNQLMCRTHVGGTYLSSTYFIIILMCGRRMGDFYLSSTYFILHWRVENYWAVLIQVSPTLIFIALWCEVFVGGSYCSPTYFTTVSINNEFVSGSHLSPTYLITISMYMYKVFVGGYY